MGNESSAVETPEDAQPRRYDAQRYVTEDAHALDEAAAEFCGFRVLGIQEQSPAARVGFVSFFDFILAANGIRLDTRDATFMELIAQSEDQPMQLDVYNLKSQTTRELTLTPSRRWPGKGLLGVTIRFDSYEHAEDQLLHVLDVVQDSPAHDAGLRPETDYLLGTPERVFRDAEDLHDEILDALDDAFQCYVYSSEDDQVRIVRIAPNDQWGGAGVLGAEVGHGVLHRLPSACRESIGTSIGFVSLSDEAKAATDPYLRKVREEEETQAQAAQQHAEMTRQTDSQHDEGKAVESVEQNESEGPETAVASVADENAAAGPTPPPAPVDTTQQPQESTTTTSSPPSPVPVPVAPDAKPRYAARIDPRFPMSTVAVLADPTQLG